MKNNTCRQKIHVLALGFCAVCAQALFIRELMGLFTGTEFTIGFLLATWLFWIGMGGVLGGRLIRPIKGKRSILGILSMVAGSMLPVSVLAIRFGRGWLAHSPGELPDYFSALLFSFLVIAPFTFVYGTIYNVASEVFREKTGVLKTGITKVYVLEAAGSIAGALVLSFILLSVFTQFETSVAVSLILMFVSLNSFSENRIVRALLIIPVVIYTLILPFVSRIDEASISRIFQGYSVKGFVSSKYSELVAVYRNGMLSLYSGGGRLFSIPEPEKVEETIHIPILSHDVPATLLRIGAAQGGGWEEAVKHPAVNSVDCMELDERLDRFIGDVTGNKEIDGYSVAGFTGAESIPDVKVNFLFGDGRSLLLDTDKKYDVIIVSTPPPVNIRWNRYYTREFFRIAKKALNAGGILALSHISSENYISRQQVKVLKIISTTLGDVFGNVTLLPGPVVHFIAGEDDTDLGKILGNQAERGLKTLYINDAFLPDRMSAERTSFLDSRIEQAGICPVNTDLYPILPYHEFILDARKHRITGTWILERAASVPGMVFPSAIAAFFVILLFLSRRKAPAEAAVFFTGFCSFLFQIVIMIVYQVFSGLLYHGIILLSAFFMAGASLGASSGWNMAGWKAGRWIRILHISFMILALSLLVYIFLSAKGVFPTAGRSHLFYLASFISGVITGSYYRVIVHSSFQEVGGPVPAVYYSWDLFGACLGGLIGGFLLLPLSGISSTLLLLVIIHGTAAVMIPGKI